MKNHPAVKGSKSMEWLKKIRGVKSQQAVADKIGIPQSTYASIESGSRNPSVSMAKRIAAVLGFNWTRFYENDEHDNSEQMEDDRTNKDGARKVVRRIQEIEERELELVGKIAAVIEQGDYTYDEAKCALFTLSSHYDREAQRFLNSASIMDIAQCRQRQFEKNAAALDKSTAAESQM